MAASPSVGRKTASMGSKNIMDTLQKGSHSLDEARCPQEDNWPALGAIMHTYLVWSLKRCMKCLNTQIW
jgi:hypothetical protein